VKEVFYHEEEGGRKGDINDDMEHKQKGMGKNKNEGRM
jgi:hypothetical protein